MKELVRLARELGHLQKIKHEGWRFVGIDHPKTVADHSLRAAQIAYFLAKRMDYANPFEVCTMLVFHDMGECRVGDIHKVAARYIDVKEEEAIKDQLSDLPKSESEELYSLWTQVEERSTLAGDLAKDADLLELALSAIEYIELGFAKAQEWIDSIKPHLKTKVAQELMASIEKYSNMKWWEGLKKC